MLSLFHFGAGAGRRAVPRVRARRPARWPTSSTPIDEHWKIYRKRRDVRAARATCELPLARRPDAAARGRPRAAARRRIRRSSRPTISCSTGSCRRASSSTRTRCLIDSFGGAERLLRMRRRRPTHERARPARRRAAHRRRRRDAARAREKARAFAFTGVRVPTATATSAARVTAEPLVHPRTGARHVLVTFQRRARATTARARRTPSRPIGELDEASRDRMQTLETELALHARDAAGDDRGARDLERGDAGDERGARRVQRGAAEHERGAALGQRGALHGQRRVPAEDRRAQGAQHRHAAPARGHRRRHGVPRSRAAHPPVHAADRRRVPHPAARHRPPDQRLLAQHRARRR